MRTKKSNVPILVRKKRGPQPTWKTLVAYEVAQIYGVCLHQARRMMSEYSMEGLVDADRLANLKEWGQSAESPRYIACHKASYLAQRRRAGFTS